MDSISLLLLSLGIIGYLYCLVHLLRNQNDQQPRVFRVCMIGILAFLGGGIVRQNVVDTLLETVPMTINIWMTLEVIVIARIGGTGANRKV
jgi:uncharacterized membrane protein AbrB (regulator of aidB expression)